MNCFHSMKAKDHTELCNGESERLSLGLLGGLMLSMFLSALDQTVLNTAIPKLSQALGASEIGPWIITSYLLFATAATPIAGKLCDAFGTRRVLVVSTVLFALSSLLCAAAGLAGSFGSFAPMHQLVCARALQGLAGGAMLAACFVSIGEVTSARERGKFQGFLAASFLVAALIGPALGGFLADSDAWRYIFLLNVPLGLLSAAVIAATFPGNLRALNRSRIDFAGVFLFLCASIPLISGFADFARNGRLELINALLLGVAGAFTALFFWNQKSTSSPFIPSEIASNRIVQISLLTVFTSGIGLFGGTLLLSVLLQNVNGMSAVASGLVLTPVVIVVALSSVVGGLLLVQTGKYKTLCLIALSLMAVGSFLLGFAASSGGTQNVVLFASISGAGLGLILPVHTIVIQNAVNSSILGVATSLTQFFRSFGGTLGTGLMTAFMLFLLERMSLQSAVSCVFILYGFTMAVTTFINIFLPEVALKKADTKLAESCSVSG